MVDKQLNDNDEFIDLEKQDNLISDAKNQINSKYIYQIESQYICYNNQPKSQDKTGTNNNQKNSQDIYQNKSQDIKEETCEKDSFRYMDLIGLVKKLFKVIDTNFNGFIESDEYRNMLRKLNVSQNIYYLDLVTKGAMSAADRKGDGKITFEEYFLYNLRSIFKYYGGIDGIEQFLEECDDMEFILGINKLAKKYQNIILYDQFVTKMKRSISYDNYKNGNTSFRVLIKNLNSNSVQDLKSSFRVQTK